MLNRREFIRISAVLAAGAALPLSMADRVMAINTSHPAGNGIRPVFRLHGHKKSGCAFQPELVDIWAGGGAQIPEDL
jgi:hypothetical protein